MLSPFRRHPLDFILGPGPRRQRRSRRKAASKDRVAAIGAEQLESRAMLAIFSVPRPDGSTVVAIDGNTGLTDLFLRNTLGGVQVATNSRFDPVLTTDAADWVYGGTNANLHGVGAGPLYITNATPNRGTFASEASGFTAGSTSPVTDFVLSNGNINSTTAGSVNGELRLGARQWTFTNNDTGGLLFTQIAGPAGGPAPRNGLSTVSPGVTQPDNRGQGVRGAITIQWTGSVSTFVDDCPRMDVSYTYRNFIGLLPPGVPRPPDLTGVEPNLGVSAGSNVNFAINVVSAPKDEFGGVTLGRVPGTVVTSGTITVHDVLPIGSTGSQRINLTFGFSDASGAVVFTPQQSDWLQIAPGSTFANLRFINAFAVDTVAAGDASVPPGRVTIAGSQRWLEYKIENRPSQVTVWPGLDVSNTITVELTRGEGSFNVLSPIINAGSLTALGTEVVNFQAPVSVSGTLTLGQSQVPQSLYPNVQTARIEAPNAAANYSFHVVGDSLLIGPSGSLSGALPYAGGELTTPSGAVNALMLDADIFALGSVYATTQFYDLKSTNASYNRNTRFTTQAGVGGADSGLIRGGTVVVAMANPGAVTAPPDAFDPDISVHTVSLRTQVDAFRTRAASSGAEFVDTDNYPYDLSIREVDAVTIDAVAGSRRPISIVAGGSIILGGGLSTVSDVTLEALPVGDPRSLLDGASLLSVSGPLATTRGKVRLIGDSVAIRDSVRVTAAEDDEFRDDIWITANAGDVSLAGEVAAVNRVKIQQFSGEYLVDRLISNRQALPLVDNGTVTQTIEVLDNFTFRDLDVEIDITHPFVGDLIGTLISPDNRRFTLFRNVGGSGDNFRQTIFDVEAATPISQEPAPFTGRFQPEESFAELYGGLSAGTWRLEIRDTATRDVGTLNSFTLRFRVLAPQAAKVSGPAIVTADSLLLDVQGVVGDSSLQPKDLGFFLRTNVDTISGSIGGSAAIDELGDVAIPSLRAGGFVSLRASGADPTTGPNAGKAALQANLIDITGLDVATPNGSVDVLFDTSKSVELGNSAALRAGRSLNSVAAGNVRIRSAAGSIVALDAPVAGGNGRTVRVATTAAMSVVVNGQTLSGVTYAPGNPGITASTLRGRGNLNAWLGVQVQPLRAGDVVLVKNQANPEQNGIYTLAFMSTATWTSTTTWTLMRAKDADTAAELPSNTFVLVGERQAGGIDQTGTWQVAANYIQLNGATGTVDAAAFAGDSVVDVTVADPDAAIEAGMVVFGEGVEPNTTVSGVAGASITLSQPLANDIASGASLKFVAPTVTRTGTTGSGLDDIFISGLATTADLQVGMLVVGQGIQPDPVTGDVTTITRILNGTTVVISNGATANGTGPVSFIRPFATRMAATTAGLATVATQFAAGDLREGMVVVGPGIAGDTTIQSVNGSTITLSKQATDTSSAASLKFLAATRTNFGLAPITVAPKPVTTDIGSDNPNSLLSFVVSTTGGTNSAAGSLGKMIALRQQNIARLGNDSGQPAGSQPMDFRFSAAVATDVTPIRLTQELPEITKAFAINGSPTYPVEGFIPGKGAPPLIDGSRITHTRSGRIVAAGDIVNGFTISGAAASGSVIRNVNVGGFSRAAGGVQSAAIDVRDAAGVLVSNVTAGSSELGIRLANGVGVRFSGAGVTSGTLLNSSVFGSNDTGLSIENNATGIRVVGSTFGRADNFNGVGATLSSGVNQFGVDAATPIQPVPQVSMTRTAANRFSFTLAADAWSPWRLVPGVQLLSPSVVPTSGNTRATISAVSTAVNGNMITVTVTVFGGTVTGNGLVTFLTTDPAAIPDLLVTRAENIFTVPNDSRIVVGMQVSGPGIRLTPGSTRATVSSRTVNGVTTIQITGGTIAGDGLVTFTGTTPRVTLQSTATKVVNVFTIPATARNAGAFLYPGLPLTGAMIQTTSTTTPATIASIARNLATGVTTVTIAGGTLTGNGLASFGHVVRTELFGTTITLPTTVDMEQLYLGQAVTGAGIAGGAVIAAIDRNARTVSFAADRPMTRTGFSVIAFGVGGRNTVTQNRNGLILAGGATTVTNTTISANTFNGIEIRGSGAMVGVQTLHHRVGTMRAPVAASNQIHSNGGWGLYFTPAVNGAKNSVTIQGNFLGTTSAAVVPSSLANKKGNIGHFTTREEVFAGLSSRLVPRAIDGIDLVNNQHGRYQSTGGGSTGTGGTRPQTR